MTSTQNPFVSKPSPGAPMVPGAALPSGQDATTFHSASMEMTPHLAVARPNGLKSRRLPPADHSAAHGSGGSAATDDLDAKRLGAWQLSRLLSRGPLTEVYEARPAGSEPNRPADYVVKRLRPELNDDAIAIGTLRREAEVGRFSSHSNLVPILEAHLDQPIPHVVMPKINGACLALVVQSARRIVVPQALWITRQVAQALHHLHHRGWVHGDVKPDNVLVARSGHSTLIDLGFAMKPEESLFSSNRPWQGTLAYVAPELLTSAGSTHPAADIYSLGVTLYEMLSGRVPFAQQDAARLVEAHLREAVPPLETALKVPDNVHQLVRIMLSKNPVRRPQSALELIELLTSLEIETLEARFEIDPLRASELG